MPDVGALESLAEEEETSMEITKSTHVTPRVSDSTEFTFHPRVSSASSRIVNNLGMDFFERQQKHMEKQRKLLEQIPQGASDQSGSKRAKFTAVQKENCEVIKKRPTTSEPTSATTRRHYKRRDQSFLDLDSPRTPMPPTSPQPNFLMRSKTYFAMTSSKSRKRAVNDPYANMDRLQQAKLKAEKAIKTKKIFSIHGPYPLIRRALRERGWVEKEFKLPPRKSKEKGDSSDVDDADDFDDDDDDQKDSGVGTSPRPDSDEDDDADNKYGIMGRMVRNEVPTFQWTTRNSSIDWRFLQKDQVVNHYAKANFTTKVGLCMNLRTLTCFADAEVNSFFPRCFRLSQEEDKLDFIDEFRLVAATAILRIAIDRHTGEESDGRDPEKTGQKPPGGSSHIVPQNVLQLAIQVCELHAQEREHDDIDLHETVCSIPEENWNLLIQNYYKLVHEGALIENSGSLLKKCEVALERLKPLNLQYNIDGLMNTWIVKPGAKSRGRGIIVMNKLDDILKLVQCDPTLMKDGRWVIQKYIERPLLVYGTKFDIRQWFLVTDWNPMMIWMYKSSYLRFSTKPFSLTNLDPSVHLCNYSVQKNFEIDSKRHPMLPEENMWSNDDFKGYLRSRGCESLWDNLIYPGMKKAIIHMCQTAQDVVDYRKGSFELYGADFMIDENYNPWLIEINSSPTMSRSTAVTHKLCATVQEDTLKVVLDRRRDKHCDLGLFELAFKQPVIDVPLYVGKSLQVEGFAVRRPGGNNNLRRSWVSNVANPIQPTPPNTQPTAGQDSKLIRSLSQPKQQPTRVINRPQMSKSNPTRATPERSGSPVKLRMQTTMNRLSNEVRSTPTKHNAFNLPRFASNSNVNTNITQQSVSKALSQSNVSKSTNTNRGTNPAMGGFHCVSTSHAKNASSMGIMHQTNGLVGAANRGSLRNCHHQVIVPKTFPPSLVPGCNVIPHKGLPASGIVAVAPHNIGLTLPLQRLLGGDMALTGNTKTRHMEIYNYPGQDFRMNGPGRQRVSGIYDWMESRRDKTGLNIHGVTFDDTNCDVDDTHSTDDCDDDNSRHCDNTNDDLMCDACQDVTSENNPGFANLPPLQNRKIDFEETGGNNLGRLKEGRLFPQFPDLCSGDFVLYPFHANEGVRHPSFSNRAKERLSKVEMYSADELTNSETTENSLNLEKLAKFHHLSPKPCKTMKKSKYYKSPAMPRPPPVLKLFSLKQRHEKNLGVAHESFLTVSCPSVSTNQNWLSTQR